MPYYDIAIWNRINAALMLSLVFLGVGTLIYAMTRSRIPLGPEDPPLLECLLRRALARMATERLQPHLGLSVAVALSIAAIGRSCLGRRRQG